MPSPKTTPNDATLNAVWLDRRVCAEMDQEGGFDPAFSFSLSTNLGFFGGIGVDEE